jgi:hypothetical protein
MNTRRPRVVPRPTSHMASRARHDIRVGVPLIALAILLLGGLIGTYVIVAGPRVDFDAETGCPATGPSGVTAILFDRTDPINDRQKLFLENKLDAFRETTQKFEEVDTYALEDQGDSVVKPLQRLCDPGRGTDVSSLTGNPRMLHERWEKQFAAPVRDMMEAMRQGGGSKTSAIFEAIQSVSLQSFQKSKLASGAERKLIIISDLIQFTKTLDFYKSDLNYQTFQLSNEARRLHTNLNGVSVEVLFISRAKVDRINRLVSFWTNWFVDQGARKDTFKVSWVEG